jgi:colanic acid biosynthesis glycosyl transferase WcaI
MKIVLLSMNFAPELTGIGKYSGEMADALVERGHEVTVVCAPPYYPRWVLQEGYSKRAYRTERHKPGLTVIRCPIWLPRRLSGLARLLHLASFAITSFPVLMRLVFWQPAVVFVVAPALFSAPAGWLTARLAGARAWLHVQDLEVDAAFELGMLKGRVLRTMVQAAERWLMRGFDVVSTISRRMLRQLASKGVALDRTELMPNWIDLHTVRANDRSGPQRCALRETLGIEHDQFVCLFSGTINRKQGLPVLIEAARLLEDRPDVVFVICGNGEFRPALEALAADLPNVRFLDLRPADELNALLNMADVHLLPQLRGAADLVMPSKLTGMLASGRPVIAAAIAGTEIASVVIGRGLVTEPECSQSFVAAICTLVDDAAQRAEYGAAARAYAERRLNSRVLFDALDGRLLELCDAQTPLVATSNLVR